MTFSIEDICNMALDGIGYAKHIGTIYEGSPASRVALEIYGQTRDELLQLGDWPFALREVVLGAVGGQTAPTPWAFEYVYPADCLRIRYVKPGPLTGGTINNDPQPILYRTWNDQRPTPAVRAILCSLATPVLIYTGRVTNPASWEPGFIRALVSALAEKFEPMLAKEIELFKARIALSSKDTQEAMAVDDMSPPKAHGMMANAAQ